MLAVPIWGGGARWEFWCAAFWLWVRPTDGIPPKSSPPASASSQRFEEAHFTFALTPQQVQQILSSR